MNNLKSLREQAGLTQQQVFRLLKIPIRTLQDWENDRRKPSEFILNTLTEFYQKEKNRIKTEICQICKKRKTVRGNIINVCDKCLKNLDNKLISMLTDIEK